VASVRAAFVLIALGLGASAVRAEPERSRFSAGGYLRVMTRPDLQGGDGKLGLWNLHGRLLNEGPYAALELRLALLPQVSARAPWTSIHAKLEGGSVQGASRDNGSLAGFRLSQLYVRAGNVLLGEFGLEIGPLIPSDAQPLQALDDAIDRLLGRALGVGVFNTQDQFTVMLLGEQPVVKGSASPTDMEIAGRTGGKADTNF